MTDDKEPSIKNQVIAWAAGQPFNNVLLLAILIAIGWGMYFGMTTAIPAHLKQIQDGYQSLTEAHREERKELREAYGQWMQRANADRKAAPTAVAEHQ